MTKQRKQRLKVTAITAVVLFVLATVFIIRCMTGLCVWSTAPDSIRNMKCEPIPQPETPILQGLVDVEFVDKALDEYEILGKWHVVEQTGYVICRKDGELWSTYYEKDTREVGVLVPLKQRIEDGDTIIYSEQTFGGEYMVIRPNGLYIYGAKDCDPYVWPNEK